jgi:hypothetical protein
MREPMHRAAARRDDRLATIRKLSLWITGGAAAASLGLGTAFAHAMPGHAATSATPTRNTATSQGAGRPGGITPASGRSTLAGARETHSASSSSSAGPSAKVAPSAAAHKTAGHSSTKLAKPANTPKPAQAPPVVVSGGS